MKPTIKDIAKATNLSTATVSRVLSNTGVFTEATAKKVRDTAEKLGYRRNASAADLSSRDTKTVAVILNNTNTNFSQPVLDGIQAAAEQQQRQIIIFYAGNNNERLLTQAITAALERPIAGILLIAAKVNEEQLKLLNAAKIPFRFVSIQNQYDQKERFVSSDNVLIGEKATEYLINHGHRTIGLVGLDRTITGKERVLGYQKAMSNANLSIDPTWILYGDYSFKAGQQLFPRIMEVGVSAVITASDMVAAGIIKAAHADQIELPDRLSIISIDGTNVCEYITPSLTSVTQNFFRMGEESLSSVLNDKRKIFVPIEITERDSVASI